MRYALFVPKQAVGANLVYFDLFNVGVLGYHMQLLSVVPVVSGAVAVIGVVGVDLFLTRTTAVGTGGTAATVAGTDLAAATFASIDTTQRVVLGAISARLTPTGGATAGSVVSQSCVFTEETADGAYARKADLVPNGGMLVQPRTGVRVVQGSVASVGNIGFNVIFDLTAL